MIQDKALSWASNLADISDEDISIIKHARKSLLSNHGKPWIKNNNSNLFDVTMGSYDEVEICELVGLFILNPLGKKFGKKTSACIGLTVWRLLKKDPHVWQTKPEKSSIKFSNNLA